MGKKLTVRAAVREVLADGKWHTIEDITSVVGHLIPPEVAYRRGIEQRTGKSKDQAPYDDVIRAGRKRALLIILNKDMVGVEKLGTWLATFRYSEEVAQSQQVRCDFCGEMYIPLSLPTRAQKTHKRLCHKPACRAKMHKEALARLREAVPA